MNPPIRILHTVYSLDPGGMENGIVNVANRLDPGRFRVAVCCLERRGAFADRLPSSVEVSAIGRQPGFSLAIVRALRREIARLRPDVIHSHNLGPLIYSGLATFGGLTVPLLQGEHAELTAAERTPRRMGMRRVLYRCCRAVHSVGTGLNEHLLGLGFPPSKLCTIVNGVDTVRFRPPEPAEQGEIRRAQGIPADALVIGIVGRFGPFKRHRELIAAFEEVAEKHPRVHLLIVGGGGPEETSARARAQASPQAARIHLTGFQRDPSVFYRAMDLLAVPSVNEGLSNAVLEAMASGVPVLGHSVCGNADAIASGTDGILANLAEPASIGPALGEALAAPDRLAAMGTAARCKIQTDFSLDKMVREYEALYFQVARRR